METEVLFLRSYHVRASRNFNNNSLTSMGVPSILFSYMVTFGLLWGFVLYYLEHDRSHISFLDCVFTSFSALCITGLVTFDFSVFQLSSQIVVLICIFMGGVTLTTIPALLIKIWKERNRMIQRRSRLLLESPPLDDGNDVTNNSPPTSVIVANASSDTIDSYDTSERSDMRTVFDWERPVLSNVRKMKALEQVLEHKPPPATDVEYLVLLWLLFLIVICDVVIIFVCFVILGLTFMLGSYDLSGNHPWWASIFITISAFNNAGMTVFTDNLVRFVESVPVNLTVAFLIVFGNTCFPVLLRSVIWICYKLAKRHKIVFKYMMEKHHHLTVHLFPSLQTRVYASITAVLLFVGTILAYATSKRGFEGTSKGTLLLISFFHSVSTRTAGFNTVDLNYFSIATIVFFIVMMRIKAQMACDLSEGAYKISTREEKFKKDHQQNPTSQQQRQQMRMNQMNLKRIAEIIDYQMNDEEDVVEETVEEVRQSRVSPIKVVRYYLAKYLKKIWYHSTYLVQRNNVWLVGIMIFIAIAESDKLRDDPTQFTFFKIVFEVISAFGNVGLSLGYPNLSVSFCGLFSATSKWLIILTMLMGRHRGLQGSFDDQEYSRYQHQAIIEERSTIAD